MMPPVVVTLLPHYAGPPSPLVPAHASDVGVDLYAAADLVIPPGARMLVPTGIMMSIPEGFEAQIRPRSGHAAKLGLSVLNSPGTIDPAYRGEVKVIAYNANPVLTPLGFDVLLDVLDGSKEVAQASEQFDLDATNNTIRIAKGEKFAQMVFAQFYRPEVLVVAALSETARGAGGFGSSGK